MKKLSTHEIAELFGGPGALSKALGLDRTAIKKLIDRGADIPRWHRDKLFREAKKRGIELVHERVVGEEAEDE